MRKKTPKTIYTDAWIKEKYTKHNTNMKQDTIDIYCVLFHKKHKKVSPRSKFKQKPT